MNDGRAVRFSRRALPNSASDARCADLICWTHFCSSQISTARQKLPCAWITFLLAARSFSLDPLLLVPLCRRVSETPEAGAFSQRGPSFPHSLCTATPDWCRFLAMVGCPRGHTVFCDGPTFTHSFGLMKSRRCALSISEACSPGYEVSEFGKHRKGTDSCLGRFGQHRDLVGAHIAEESGPL
jgi:hypothetical protein